MKQLSTRQIALNGIAAGLYAAVTILTASFSYGNVQFRLAEALCVLVCFEPSLTIGLTLGCLISNLFSTVSALDIFVGTAATFIACVLTAGVRKVLLVPLPSVLTNALLVGSMLSFLYMPEAEFWKGLLLMGGSVALGEAAVLYALGVPLYLFLRKSGLIETLLQKKDRPDSG